jgi:hypothetical protein
VKSCSAVRRSSVRPVSQPEMEGGVRRLKCLLLSTRLLAVSVYTRQHATNDYWIHSPKELALDDNDFHIGCHINHGKEPFDDSSKRQLR